jgi:5'(3')-deoxyribonucleotidase
MSAPRFRVDSSISDSFVRLVDVIFGVIMAQGFVIYRSEITEPSFSVGNGSLILVYATIVLSWIGYHKSTVGYPYNKTLWSRFRLFLDILILVLYAYLVFVAENFAAVLIGLVAVFLLYAITGAIRIVEWKDKKVGKPGLSILFAIAFSLEFVAITYCQLCIIRLGYWFVASVLLLTMSLVFTYRGIRGKLGYPTIIPIGVDIDGVLGEQVPPVLARVQTRKQIGQHLTKDKITKWDFSIDGSSIDREIEEALLDPEFVREMPVVSGSTTAMAELYERFHVVVTTSRPLAAEVGTIAWLKKNFNYHEYANARLVDKEALGLKILVDDYPENIKRFALAGGTAIIFSQPWNQKDSEIEGLIHAGKVIRCDGWKEVKDQIYRLERTS